MNILFLQRPWPVYGGGETVTVVLANELARRGHNVYVAYFKDTSKGTKELPVIDGRIKSILIPNVKLDEFTSDLFVKKEEAHYVSDEVVKIVRQNSIDIIHNQFWPTEYFKGVHSQTNCKIVSVLHHDIDPKKVFGHDSIRSCLINAFYPLYRMAEHWKNMRRVNKLCDNSDLLYFLSPSYLKRYRAMRKDIDTCRTDYVFNPIVFSEAISKEDMSKKENVVLFVGRLEEKQKQVLRLLKIWQTVSKYNESWELKIVGDGPDRGVYEKYVAEKDIHRVSFEGFRIPLDYYRKASIFVMTSAYEGLPMTLIEAQQNGVVPVVMNTFSSVNDIIENNISGIITPPDENAFAVALNKLMNNETVRKEMAEQVVKGSKRFSTSSVVDRWEEIYADLCKR